MSESIKTQSWKHVIVATENRYTFIPHNCDYEAPYAESYATVKAALVAAENWESLQEAEAEAAKQKWTR